MPLLGDVTSIAAYSPMRAECCLPCRAPCRPRALRLRSVPGAWPCAWGLGGAHHDTTHLAHGSRLPQHDHWLLRSIPHRCDNASQRQESPSLAAVCTFAQAGVILCNWCCLQTDSLPVVIEWLLLSSSQFSKCLMSCCVLFCFTTAGTAVQRPPPMHTCPHYATSTLPVRLVQLVQHVFSTLLCRR